MTEQVFNCHFVGITNVGIQDKALDMAASGYCQKAPCFKPEWIWLMEVCMNKAIRVGMGN